MSYDQYRYQSRAYLKQGRILGKRIHRDVVCFILDHEDFHVFSPLRGSAAAITFITPVANTSKRIVLEICVGEGLAMTAAG